MVKVWLGREHKRSCPAKELEIELLVGYQVEGNDQVPEGEVGHGLRYLVGVAHPYFHSCSTAHLDTVSNPQPTQEKSFVVDNVSALTI